MSDRDDAVLEERDRDRRAHAGRVRVLARPVVDLAVRLLDERDDPRLAAAVDRLAERSRRHSRGDLSASCAAHAVGHGEERGMADPGVLVAPTLAARVGKAGAAAKSAHASNLRSVSPTRTRSPAASFRARLRRTPFTNVPFVEPVSSIHTPSRRGSTRAWFADA